MTISNNSDHSGVGFSMPFNQAGSRRTVFSTISNRSGSTTTPFTFVMNSAQSNVYAKQFAGFSDSDCDYQDFGTDDIFVSGTYETS